MVARKIFHVFVGMFLGYLIFVFPYFAATLVYSVIRSAFDDFVPPLLGELPRFALIASVAFPLALAAFLWRVRRYVAIGLLVFSVLSLASWRFFGR